MKNQSKGGRVLGPLDERRRRSSCNVDTFMEDDGLSTGLVGEPHPLTWISNTHGEIALRLRVRSFGGGVRRAVHGEALDRERGTSRPHGDQDHAGNHYGEEKDEEDGAEDPFQAAEARASPLVFVPVAVLLGQVGILRRRDAVDLVLGDLNDVGSDLERGLLIGLVRFGRRRVMESNGGRCWPRRCAGQRLLRHGGGGAGGERRVRWQ